MGFNDGVLTLSLPELSTVSAETWLAIGLGINMVYGFITHIHSLPSIRRHNKKQENTRYEHYKVDDFGIVALLVYRLFLNLPGRIICFAIGIMGAGLVFVSSGKFKSNEAINFGWHWHLEPDQLMLP